MREEFCLAFSTDRPMKSPVQIPKNRRNRGKNKGSEAHEILTPRMREITAVAASEVVSTTANDKRAVQ